jgi:hypothetical protein
MLYTLSNDVTAAAPSGWDEAQDLQFCASGTPRNILSAKSSKEFKCVHYIHNLYFLANAFIIKFFVCHFENLSKLSSR